MQENGVFPFGRPNTVRPARVATAAPRAAVVGVYPSAWHISWRAPAFARSAGRKGTVAALAVDVEPTVFWNGSADNFALRLAEWSEAVGFREGDGRGQHGYISATSPPTNGSSGQKVVDRYLRPLGIEESSVTFTDVYPVFFVKYGSGRGRREQGDAIRDEYDGIGSELGLVRSSLPARPAPANLPRLAATRFADRLVSDLTQASAELIITLGPEVWATLLLIPELRARPPCSSFEALYGRAYGSTGALSIGGRNVAWLPVVHPGLLRGEATSELELDPGQRTHAGWNALHSRWARAQQTEAALRGATGHA